MKKEQALKALAEGFRDFERGQKKEMRDFLDSQKRQLAWHRKNNLRLARVISRLEIGTLYEFGKTIDKGDEPSLYVADALVLLKSLGKESVTLQCLAAPVRLSFPFHRTRYTAHVRYSMFIQSSWSLKKVKPDGLPGYLGWAWKSPEFDRLIKGE